MNFRLVWVGSDDDGNGSPAAQQSAAAVIRGQSRATSYELRGAEMVRCERLDSGRRRVTAVANFRARIVGADLR
jgi:hypothetical protein